MADIFQVKITDYAQSQLKEITQYISHELENPEAAIHTLNILEKSISSLSQLPERVALTEEQPWHNLGIHKLPVKNFFIYFWIDKKHLKVQITAIVYMKRDQNTQLSQMFWE